MRLEADFREFIECLTVREVRYLVVGGYAVAAHGLPRATKDFDVWVWIDRGNATRLVAALDDFGFGEVGLTASDFDHEDVVVQLGYPGKSSAPECPRWKMVTSWPAARAASTMCLPTKRVPPTIRIRIRSRVSCRTSGRGMARSA